MHRSPLISAVTSKKFHLRALARAVHQRHVDLGALPAPLAQALEHEAQADLVAFLTKLAVQPPPRDALLRRGPLRPLLKQFVEARLHPFEDRPRPRPLLLLWLRHRRREVSPHRVARESHLARHPALALALHEHLVPQRVYVLHSEHPFLPPASGSRRHKGGPMPRSGLVLNRSLVGF